MLYNKSSKMSQLFKTNSLSGDIQCQCTTVLKLTLRVCPLLDSFVLCCSSMLCNRHWSDLVGFFWFRCASGALWTALLSLHRCCLTFATQGSLSCPRILQGYGMQTGVGRDRSPDLPVGRQHHGSHSGRVKSKVIQEYKFITRMITPNRFICIFDSEH